MEIMKEGDGDDPSQCLYGFPVPRGGLWAIKSESSAALAPAINNDNDNDAINDVDNDKNDRNFQFKNPSALGERDCELFINFISLIPFDLIYC